MKRREALKKKGKVDKNADRIVVPLDYNPHMAKASDVLNKHYRAKNQELLKVFPANPMAGLRQPKNLRRIMCSSKLPPVTRSDRLKRQTQSDAPVWKKCGKPCPVCPYTLPNCSEVVANITGYRHTIEVPVNCNTENCIYYWKCVKNNCIDYPRCEYIGMTKRAFRHRFAEHRNYPKQDFQNKPSGDHFTKKGHSVANLRGQVLEKVKSKDPFVLRESYLIQCYSIIHYLIFCCMCEQESF